MFLLSQNYIEWLAILAFAYSGIYKARQYHMDFIGTFSLAFISSFGGGTIRDILLGNHPLQWIENYYLIIFIFIFCLLIIKIPKKILESKHFNYSVDFVDSIGLGLFAISGFLTAYKLGINIVPCIVMGIITSVFGGIIRDIICNEIPYVFKNEYLYATCAFISCCFFAISVIAFGISNIAIFLSIFIISFLRMFSLHKKIRL